MPPMGIWFPNHRHVRFAPMSGYGCGVVRVRPGSVTLFTLPVCEHKLSGQHLRSPRPAHTPSEPSSCGARPPDVSRGNGSV